MSDRLEAGTFAIAAAVTGGDSPSTAPTRAPRRLPDLLARWASPPIRTDDDGLRVGAATGSYRPDRSRPRPIPASPTDLQAPLAVLMTQADGDSTHPRDDLRGPPRLHHGAGQDGRGDRGHGRAACVHRRPDAAAWPRGRDHRPAGRLDPLLAALAAAETIASSPAWSTSTAATSRSRRSSSRLAPRFTGSMPESYRFKAVLQEARGGGAGVMIPLDVAEAMGGRKQFRVTGTLQRRADEELHRSRTGAKGLWLGVHKATREKAGVAFGDEVEHRDQPGRRAARGRAAARAGGGASPRSPRCASASKRSRWTRRRELAEPIAQEAPSKSGPRARQSRRGGQAPPR